MDATEAKTLAYYRRELEEATREMDPATASKAKSALSVLFRAVDSVADSHRASMMVVRAVAEGRVDAGVVALACELARRAEGGA